MPARLEEWEVVETMVEFMPRTRRATNRLAEHSLTVVCEGVFGGQAAVLTRCTDTDCPNIARDGASWTGWFTDNEVDVVERSRSGWSGGAL